MLLHSHLKNVSIVCLELHGLAFFDTDCEVVSPDLKLKKDKKTVRGKKKYNACLHNFYNTEYFSKLYYFKMSCALKFPEHPYLFVPCGRFMHCCPLLKPPEK